MVSEGELVEVPVVQHVNANGDNAFVSLSWDAVSGADGYNIYRAPIEGGELTLLSERQTDLVLKDDTVTNGTMYYYAVTAVIGNSESNVLDMVSATPAFPINSVIISNCIEDMTIGVGKSTTEATVTIEVNGLTDAVEHVGKEAPNMLARLVYYLEGSDKAKAVDTKLRYQKKDLENGSKVYQASFEPTEPGVFHYFAKVSTNNGQTYMESAELHLVPMKIQLIQPRHQC